MDSKNTQKCGDYCHVDLKHELMARTTGILLLAAAACAFDIEKLTPPIRRSVATNRICKGDFQKNGTLCDVTAFGALGDGKTDDSDAFQGAFAACAHGLIYVPEGNYFIDKTVTISTSGTFEFRGDGWESNVLWHHDGNLFQFSNGVTTATVIDIAITAVGGDKSPASTALAFPVGLAKSNIQRVLFNGRGAIPAITENALIGTAIDMGAISDTCSVVDCVFWFLQGTGVKIGKGSEVRNTSTERASGE
jgi:hypothetical protein